MNKFFTLVIAFACICSTKSQSQSRDVIEINPRVITYDKKLSFTHINIIDRRNDTTKIGYILKGNLFRKLTLTPCFSSGIENNLNSSLKSNFDLSKNASLLIVIKNFWLKDAFLKKQTELGNQCIVKLEFYLKKDTSHFPY